VINLTITAHDGHLYELIGRHSQSQSSAARLYRNDPYLTQRLIARLPLEPDTWLQILNRLGLRPTDLESRQPGGIHQVIANAIVRGDLNLYKLPLLDSANSLRGKSDMGLCIIKGPKPHCATHLSAAPIFSPGAAQALLNELGIEPGALLGYLTAQNLYNSYDQQKPLDEILKRLANGELLAYKIPLPPMSVPEKMIELVDAAEPRYEPVPLAPDSNAYPLTATAVAKPTEPLAPEVARQFPKSLDECEARLVKARERLDKHGYHAKYTDEEQLAKVQNNSVSKERFLVSFQTKDPAPNAKLAFQRESGLVPLWATSFDQLEYADSDPKLIADILATPYDPSKEYVLHVVDRGENLDQFGQNTFVPTWDNMQAPTQKYLGGKHDPNILSEVMTDEFQQKYAADMDAYHSLGLNEFNKEDQKEFASTFFSPEKERFSARHNVRTELGANSEFTGNGLTQSREGSTAFGIVETLTLENNAPPISAMSNAKTITLKPGGLA
jgi:hypothetical protein